MKSAEEKFKQHLAQCYTAITEEQASWHYFEGNVQRVKQILQRWRDRGLIDFSVELVRPRQNSATPIQILRVGQVAPSPHKIAYVASTRWVDCLVPTLVIRGTATLRTLYGGVAKDAITAHLSHEVALTDVFLRKYQENTDFTWELVRSRPGLGPQADAVSANGSVEIIGRYGASSVRAKLELIAQTNLEIW